MDNVFFLTSGKVQLKEDKDNSYVEGYISTTDRDLINDIVTEDCLKSMFKQMEERKIKFDVEHESFKGEGLQREINKTINPIAKVDWAGRDHNGLLVKATLNPNHQRFDEVKGSIKDGFLDAFSIAYIPVKDRKVDVKGEKVRMLDDINLLNVAFTGQPINPNATMTNVVMKSLDYLIETKPFAGYSNFADCVRKNKSKRDPKAYCADIKRKVEGKDDNAPTGANKEGFKMEEEKKPETEEKVEVKGLEKDLAEIKDSLKSIDTRVKALEEPKTEGGEEGGEKPKEPEEPTETALEEVKALKAEIVEMKKKLEKSPQYKATQGDMKAGLTTEEPEKTPLQYI